MEDLVQFVKDLSPCLSKVSHDIDARSRDLLNPYQRDALQHHLEQVKTLAPILICSMKIFIQILGHQDGKGMDEAVENLKVCWPFVVTCTWNSNGIKLINMEEGKLIRSICCGNVRDIDIKGSTIKKKILI